MRTPPYPESATVLRATVTPEPSAATFDHAVWDVMFPGVVAAPAEGVTTTAIRAKEPARRNIRVAAMPNYRHLRRTSPGQPGGHADAHSEGSVYEYQTGRVAARRAPKAAMNVGKCA